MKNLINKFEHIHSNINLIQTIHKSNITFGMNRDKIPYINNKLLLFNIQNHIYLIKHT